MPTGAGGPATPSVAIVATLDTKEPQARYVAEVLRRQGVAPWIVDVGLARCAAGTVADATNGDVAAAAGTDLEAVRALTARHQVMSTMGRGAAAVLARRLDAGGLQGVIALGGNQGAAIAGMAMEQLPFGLPKVIVTTVASGNVRPFVGCKDIFMLFSVADLAGPVNRVTAPVLLNAALAVGAMAQGGGALPRPERLAIGVTLLGNTQAAADTAMARLAAAGYEPVAFHASGACGSALEDLVEAGEIAGVLDLTPHDLGEEVMGDGAYVPVRPGRLTAAGRRGVPQVVSTGALDYLCFVGAIPPKYLGRPAALHNPVNPNVRLTGAELAVVGEVMAARLNSARGPAAVFVPLRGWSVYGSRGGPLHDPDADAALVRSLEARLDPRVPLHHVDAHINDPEFANTCVDALLAMLRRERAAATIGAHPGGLT